jgi:hypothetical protein
VVVLLSCLLVDLGFSSSAIVLGVLFFAVHPLTVEPVAAISFRTDILTAFFLLSAVIALRREQSILALAAALGAMLSKESGLLLPVALLWIGWRRYRYWLTGSLAFAGIIASIRILLVRSPPEADLLRPGGSFEGALVNAPALFVRSLALIFGPVSCPDRSTMPAVVEFWEAVPFWATAVLVGVSTALIWRAKKLAGCLLLMAFLFLTPYLGFYPLKMILCDRYLYVTLMLVGSTIAAVLSALRSSRLQRRVVLIGSLVVFIAAVATLQNHPLWWHHHALFERTAQCAPESRAATYNYGRLLVAEGNYEEALPYLRTSVKVEPRYSKAWLALGAAHLSAGRPESALAAFRRTEELSGSFAPVAMNSALALLDMGDTTAAVSELRRALTISPTYGPAAEALEKLGNVRRVSGDSGMTLQ